MHIAGRGCGEAVVSWLGKLTAPPMAASQYVFCRYSILLDLESTSVLAFSAVNSLGFWGVTLELRASAFDNIKISE